MDNIFKDFLNKNNLTIEHFAEIIKNEETSGDILEFGVCSGHSTITLAKMNPKRKLFGFDHFEGLEQSRFPCPVGWWEGAFRLNDPNHSEWIPKTLEEITAKLSPYKNIHLIIEDIHKLAHPSLYGISKIAAVHIDVDIYEPTVSALQFVNQCQWEKLFIRFDDWHGHESLYDYHERSACLEWLTKNNYQFDIPYNGSGGGVIVFRESC